MAAKRRSAADFRKLAVAAKSNQVVINATVIDKMVSNRRFLAAFPFLQAEVGKKQKTCKPCQYRAAAVSNRAVVDYHTVKLRLAKLPGNKRQELKNLLHTKQIKIMYRVGRVVHTVII